MYKEVSKVQYIENKSISFKPIVYLTSLKEISLDTIKKVEYTEDAVMVKLSYSDFWRVTCYNNEDVSRITELFWDICTFKDSLNKEYVYMFLLKHPKYQNIIKQLFKSLQLVTIVDKDYKEVKHKEISDKCDIIIKISNTFRCIKNKEEYITNIKRLEGKRGVFLISDKFRYLYEFEHYKNLKKLKGKPDEYVKRYCQLYFTERKEKFIRYFYNDKRYIFKHFDRILMNYFEEYPEYERYADYKYLDKVLKDYFKHI